MSPYFEVPAQLFMVLSLALSPAGGEASGAPSQPTPLKLRHVDAATAAGAAAGPMRFTADTWLRAFKQAPVAERLAALQARIFKTTSGRHYVPVASERADILQLRNDRPLAEVVAASYAKSNAVFLRASLARAVTIGDLALAHFLGPERAASILKPAAPVARAEDAPPKNQSPGRRLKGALVPPQVGPAVPRLQGRMALGAPPNGWQGKVHVAR